MGRWRQYQKSSQMIMKGLLHDFPQFHNRFNTIFLPILQKEPNRLQNSLLTLVLTHISVPRAHLHQQTVQNKHQIPHQLLFILFLTLLFLLHCRVDFDLTQMRIILVIVCHQQRFKNLTWVIFILVFFGIQIDQF